MEILNLLVRIFLFSALILNTSCASTKQEQSVLQEQKVDQDEKKIAKQSAAMIAFDVNANLGCQY